MAGRQRNRSIAGGRPAAEGARLAALLLFAWFALAPVASATNFTVTEPGTFTETVADESHDAFAVTAPSGQSISVSVTVTAGGPVDFWIFNQTEFDSYENTQGSVFYHGKLLSATHYSAVVSSGSLRYLVVDNEYRTANGSVPSGPVTYTAVFSNTASGLSSSFITGALIGTTIPVGIGVLALYARWRAKKAARVPPAFPQAAPAAQPQYAAYAWQHAAPAWQSNYPPQAPPEAPYPPPEPPHH